MPYYPGKWNAYCDVCGFSFFNDELLDRWDGAKVCKKDWEPRHPQEFVRGVPESTVPWTRPEPPDIFIGPTYLMDNNYWGEYTIVPSEIDPDSWYAKPDA